MLDVFYSCVKYLENFSEVKLEFCFGSWLLIDNQLFVLGKIFAEHKN
jgi:hypothetical protein